MEQIKNNAMLKDDNTTVRVKAEILEKLMSLAGELVLVRNQQLLGVDKQDAKSRSMVQRLDIVTSELQEFIMRTRLQPMGDLFQTLEEKIKEFNSVHDKEVEVKFSGQHVEVDQTILESLLKPVTNLVKHIFENRLDSIEQSLEKAKTPIIEFTAFHEAGQLNLQIEDELGSSFSDDVIRELSVLIEQIGGSLESDSKQKQGASVLFRLPLTLAIIPSLIIVSDNYRYAIPQVNMEELVCLYDDDVRDKVERAEGQEVYRLRDQLLPLIRMNEVLERDQIFDSNTKTEIAEAYKDNPAKSMTFAVLKVGNQRFGLIVDKVLGTEEIVVKPMHPMVKKLGIYSGATVLGDGKVALILDADGIVQHANVEFSINTTEDTDNVDTFVSDETQTVLLFKNGPAEQFAVSLPLIRRIEKISTDKIERIGNQAFITIDGVSTRVLKLDDQLQVSKAAESEEMFLLLPKHAKNPFGVLISSIIDVAETPANLNVDSYMDEGLMGTYIVNDQMTLFIDFYHLNDMAETGNALNGHV